MKKLLFLFTALLFFTAAQIKAQTYHKFLNHSSWYESENNSGQLSYFYYNQSTDTIIHNLTYAKILPGSATPFFVREDTIAKKIFILTVNDTAEVILYDFSLNIGDTLYAKHGWGANNKLIVQNIDTVPTLQGQRKGLYLSDSSGNFNYYTIESIGCPLDPFLNDYAIGDPQSNLVCSYQNKTQLYDCACGLVCFDYVPVCFDSAYTVPFISNDDNFIISADFNNDGNADLATSNYYTGVSVALGNGLGGFTGFVNYISSNVFGLNSADVNNDGNKDIVAFGFGVIYVSLGNGLGSFAPALNFPSGANNTESPDINRPITLADYNGDGKLDIAVISYQYNNNSSGVSVLLGNGNGTFGTPQGFQTIIKNGSVISADFNNDNKIDLAVSGAGISILLGNGAGSFAASINYLTSFFHQSLTNADYNADGKMDLATTGNDSVYVLLGNGIGGFSSIQVVAFKQNQYPIFSADFNADGKMDLATGGGNIYYTYSCSSCSDFIAIFSGNGMGNFILADTFHVNSGAPFSITGGDFNSDGITDLATTTFTASSSASILLSCNTGTNTTIGINNQTTYSISPIKIYPTPANNKIIIDTQEITEIKLFDVLGKEIISTKEKEIDVSNFSEGVYFIQVKTKENNYTQKIIVQH